MNNLKNLFLSFVLLAASFLMLNSSESVAKSFFPDSFSAEFTQVYVSVLKGRTKKSFGNIKYHHPGKLYLEMRSPEKSLFISNQNESWYYVPPFDPKEKGEVIVQKSSNMMLSQLFDTMRMGLQSNKLYSVKEESGGVKVSFKEETAKQLKVEELMLIFKQGIQQRGIENLKEMQIIHLGGKKVSLKFNKLAIGIAHPKKQFHFEIPENTKITYKK